MAYKNIIIRFSGTDTNITTDTNLTTNDTGLNNTVTCTLRDASPRIPHRIDLTTGTRLPVTYTDFA